MLGDPLMAQSRNGNREIREALAESRRLFYSCALFSVFVNLLMLTGRCSCSRSTTGC